MRVRFVCEPIFVLRHAPARQRFGKGRDGHVVRIAEQEITDARLATFLHDRRLDCEPEDRRGGSHHVGGPLRERICDHGNVSIAKASVPSRPTSSPSCAGTTSQSYTSPIHRCLIAARTGPNSNSPTLIATPPPRITIDGLNACKKSAMARPMYVPASASNSMAKASPASAASPTC